jgi:hypothetical protein
VTTSTIAGFVTGDYLAPNHVRFAHDTAIWQPGEVLLQRD